MKWIKSRNFVVALLSAILLGGCDAARAQELLWQSLYDAGCKSMKEGNFSESEKQLKAALGDLNTDHSDERRKRVLRKLAATYALQDKFKESLTIWRDLLEADEKGKDVPHKVLDLRNIALLSRKLGDLTGAEAYYKLALSVTAAQSEDGSVAPLLEELALLYQEQGHYQQVEPLLRRALSVIEKDPHPDDEELAQALNLLASFYVLRNRLVEAEPLYKLCISLRSKQVRTNEQNVTDVDDLARLYRVQGKTQDAERLLTQAISVEEKNGDSLPLAIVLTDLGYLYKVVDRFSDAEAVFKRALAIRTTVAGPASKEYVESLKDLALLYTEQDNYAAAEPLLKQVIDFDNENDAARGSLPQDLNSLAMLYLRQGKYSESEVLYKQALNAVRSTEGEKHPDVATCLNNLGWLNFNAGRFDVAAQQLTDALALRRETLGAQHPLVAQNLMNLALIEQSRHRLPEAQKLIEQALAIERTAFGDDHETVAIALSLLGQAQQSAGNLSSAEQTFRTLLARDQRMLDATDPAIAADLDSLSSLLREQGKLDEANRLKAKATSLKAQVVNEVAAAGSSYIDLKSEPMPCEIKDKWALVVGISNFKDPSFDLKYAAKDAIDFRNYLVNEANFRPDHVKLLTDAQATRDNIVGFLGDRWLKRLANSQDLVVIYISSHGSAAKEEVGGTNFILPYDGNLGNMVFTGIPMQWLTAGLKEMVHCNRFLLVLDVCHGGAALPGAKGIVREHRADFKSLSVGMGEVVLASSGSEQVSWESKRYANGVFTKRLIEGLRLKGDSTTLGEAYSYSKEKIEEEVLRDRAELQTPLMLTRLWKGRELVLQIMPSQPRPGLAEPEVSKQQPVTTSASPKNKMSEKSIRAGSYQRGKDFATP